MKPSRQFKLLIAGNCDEHLAELLTTQVGIALSPLQVEATTAPTAKDSKFPNDTFRLIILMLNPVLRGDSDKVGDLDSDLGAVRRISQGNRTTVIVIHNHIAGHEVQGLIAAGATAVFWLPFDSPSMQKMIRESFAEAGWP